MSNPDVRTIGWSVYRRLLGYAWRYRAVFALALVGMAITALTGPALAALLKPIMDGGFVERNEQWIRMIPFVLLGLFLVRGVANFVGDYAISWVGRRVVFDIREAMFSRMIRLPMREYDRQSSSAFVSKVLYDVEQVATAATRALTTLVEGGVTVIGLLAWMFYLEWRLTLAMIVLTPIIAVLVRVASRRFRVVSRDIQDTMGGLAHVSREAVQGQRVVKVFGGQPYEEEAFRHANNRNRQQQMKKAAVAAASVPAIQFVAGVALAAIVFYATTRGASGGVTVGTFVSYLGAMLLLLSPIKHLARINEQLQAGIAAAHSAFQLMDSEQETDSGTVAMPRAQGRVEFRDVGFRYPTSRQVVVEGISFTIEPGQVLALVGPSGSGKSTIASLLSRFYDVDTGEVCIDGVNVNDIVLRDLRSNLSVVTQDVILFDDTVRRNIVYGSAIEDIDEDRLNEAVDAAHVREFISALPEGLDTKVGERGVRLSGGQRQRIAIARALYKDAPILILDEATSSLDAESERLVKEATDRLMRARTTLVIAHRLSTIEHADQIIVLSEGRIVESGRHADLLERGSMYSRLYRNRSASRKAVG